MKKMGQESGTRTCDVSGSTRPAPKNAFDFNLLEESL